MLTLQNTEAIRRIEEAIGYTFNDKRLLIQVLTRKTYLKIDPEAPDNEVLEFYGDTLMNYHVTNYFMSKYAHMLDDGLFFMRTVEQFTDMRSHYVCNRYLTDRIKAMGLARYLRAQNRDSELRRDGEKAYADIFESLVGAIYLDSYQNDTLIRAFILRQLGIEPKRLPADIEAFDYDSLTVSIPAEEAPIALEEPETIVDLAEVEPVAEAVPDKEVPALEVPVVEEIPSEAVPVAESVAEEERTEEGIPAAENIVALPVPVPTESVTAVAVIQTKQEALAAFCRQWGYDQPTYGETPPNAPNARPVAACTMKYKDAKGKVVKISLNDSGRTLAEATEKAAAKMLKRLERQTAETAAKANKAEDELAETSLPEPVAEESEPVAQPMPEVRAPESTETTAEEVVESVAEPVAVSTPEAETVEVAEPIPADTVAIAPAEENVSVEEAVLAEDSPVEPKEEAIPEVVTETVQTAEEPITAVETVREDEAIEPVQIEEFVQQTMVLNMDEAPVEDIKPAKNTRKKKAESSDDSGDVKSAKPKRAPAKKKAPSVEDKPVEDNAVAEIPSEPVAEADVVAPAKEPKPRTRKPRTKKVAEVIEATVETEKTETEAE
ncbi:MAG: hypothetical protein IJY50_03415 [Clostridia bacterium]|nr:hypothetical protein [Clostridia bacterium]